MDLPDQFREQVREICRLYNTAESDLKNIGRVEQELLITAVNQLRYAGQHLLRALDSDDVDRIRSELDAAKRHCQRAIYDVNDSGAQFYLEMIDRFRWKDYARVDLSEVIPDYKDHIKSIQSARQALEVDADSQRDREAFYHAAREHVTTLKGIWDLFEECEPELARARSKANRQILATWAALFGAIGGVGFVVLRVLGLA